MNSTIFTITFFLDSISLSFLGVVIMISTLVILYSKSYIGICFTTPRFILLLSSFVARMALITLSLNIVRILIGWDGLGLSSFLLVIFFQNEKSNAAGLITALTNRLGDVAILVLIAIIVERGSWNFIHIVECNFTLRLLVVLAAITKRAQIPFSAWLPAAIAAPTPVSALVHSSTLVTAGVYLLIRFESILQGKVKVMLFLIAVLTITLARVSANLEFDFKKVIALSTLSQLGVIIAVMAIGFKLIAFFHLLSHAVFKALLFLCAGKIIHGGGGSQDVRFIRAGRGLTPLTSSLLGLSSLALIGFPFMAGFYSKDLLIEQTLWTTPGLWTFILFFFSTGLSASYSFRLIYLTLLFRPIIASHLYVEDSDIFIIFPICFLGGFAVFGGAIFSWGLFNIPLCPLVSIPEKLIALFTTIAGAFIGIILAYGPIDVTIHIIYKKFLAQIWFIPAFSAIETSQVNLMSRKLFNGPTEAGWLELIRGQGTFRNLSSLSTFNTLFQIREFKTFIKLLIPAIFLFVCLYSL